MRIPFPIRIVALAAVLLFWIPGSGAQDSGNQSVDLEFPSQPVIQDPQFAQKERALLDVLKTNPDNPRAEIELARLYQARRFYPRAAAVLEDVTARHPEISEAHFYLGQIYGSQKTDPQRSLDELQKAIQLAPDRTDYREEIVNVYYRLQRYPPALQHLEEILKREPGNAGALYRKAAILHTQGRVEEAEAIVDRLPRHEHARVLRAIIRQQRGENAKAADVGGAVVMLFVLAGVVDETDVRREVQHGSNDRRRQRRSQDEYKQAPHGDSSLYRCCACRLRGR